MLDSGFVASDVSDGHCGAACQPVPGEVRQPTACFRWQGQGQRESTGRPWESAATCRRKAAHTNGGHPELHSAATVRLCLLLPRVLAARCAQHKDFCVLRCVLPVAYAFVALLWTVNAFVRLRFGRCALPVRVALLTLAFPLLHSCSEWTSDGQLWVQYVSSTPATRLDVINLQVRCAARVCVVVPARLTRCTLPLSIGVC